MQRLPPEEENALEQERTSVILQHLYRNGATSVAELAQMLSCSEATVRRDLQELAGQNRLVRTHGGARVRVPAPNPLGASLAAEKSRIGAAAALLVEERDAIGFNGGSTCFHVAAQLRAMRAEWPVTAVTNALNVASELATGTAFKVVMTGGVVSKRSLECGGPLATAFVSDLHLNRVFIGVDGFSLEHGVTTDYEVEGHITKDLISKADQLIVVADHSKLGRVAFVQIVPASAVQVLVTDSGAPAEFVAAAEARGIRVIQA